MDRILIVIFFAVITAFFIEEEPVINSSIQVVCPPSGAAKTPKEKALNVLKNRDVPVLPDPLYISLTDLIKADNDTTHFKNTTYVSLMGYVVGMENAGGESCNCGSNKEIDHNTYLYIGKTTSTPKSDCILIVITSAYKKSHPTIGYGEIFTGIKYYIEGYLLLNYEHKQNPTNWEVFPVCKINPI